MENFDRENIDELWKIHQIRQYFPLCHTVHTYKQMKSYTIAISEYMYKASKEQL